MLSVSFDLYGFCSTKTFTCATTLCRPPKCPDNLFELMSECLEQDSDNRPRFTDIVAYLNKFKSNNDSNDLSDSDTSSVNV